MQRLQALPEPQRAAIVMRELEGLGPRGDRGGPGPDRRRRPAGDLPGAAGPAGRSGCSSRCRCCRRCSRRGLRRGRNGRDGSRGRRRRGRTGAGVALKATAATVLVAGAVGAGVALKDSPHGGEAKAAPARISRGGANAASAPSSPYAIPARQYAAVSATGRAPGERPKTTARIGPGRDGTAVAIVRGRGKSRGGNGGQRWPCGRLRSGSSGRGDGGSGGPVTRVVTAVARPRATALRGGTDSGVRRRATQAPGTTNRAAGKRRGPSRRARPRGGNRRDDLERRWLWRSGGSGGGGDGDPAPAPASWAILP